MDAKRRYRLRVENCIGTIIDVHRRIGGEFEDHEYLWQFEELRDAVRELDMSVVCEGDVLMVERATNALLKEFKKLFDAGELGLVYPARMS